MSYDQLVATRMKKYSLRDDRFEHVAADVGEPANAVFPPNKTVRLHVIPSIKRDAPVLSPLLKERIALAHAFGW